MSVFETTAIRGLLITALVGMLIACGGGNGSSSESVVARGVITGLGSIWVNGVEYETPNGGSYSNDDSTSTIASYKVGQVVSLRGSRNSDGVSGTATEVEFEAEIEGAAGAGNTINGVTIITDQTLNPGTRYEISGFWVNNTTLHATYVGLDDDSDLIDEVKGEVDAVDNTSITVNGVTYLFTDADLLFSVGNIVEVHFDPTTSPFVATLIELEDAFFDDPDEGLEAEVEGPVNLTPADIATCPTTSFTTVFMIGATCIDWSSVPSDGWQDGLTDETDLVSGLRVEAEGHFNADGLLIAEKIKGRGNQVRITAIATSIDGTAGTLVVFDGVATPIDVTFENGLTEIDNNGSSSISSANDGEGFEIRGIRTGATSVLALRIKDETVNLDRHELRAEVDNNGVDSSPEPNNTITVMGISSIVDSNTKLEDEDAIIWPGDGTTAEVDIDDFLNSIDDDGIVNIANGPNDVVEVRIDLTSGVGSLVSPYTAVQVEIEHEDD